jgi:hypothetical protein
MPHFKPPISEIQLRIQGRQRPTVDLPQVARTPTVLGRLDLFTQGFTPHPSGPVAYTTSRYLRPTTAPTSTASCLMALLRVDDPCGPIYSASLWPWRLLGRSRPLHLRVDDPALCHYASGRGDPGHHRHPRRVL